jgi:hypothetical protein
MRSEGLRYLMLEPGDQATHRGLTNIDAFLLHQIAPNVFGIHALLLLGDLLIGGQTAQDQGLDHFLQGGSPRFIGLALAR